MKYTFKILIVLFIISCNSTKYAPVSIITPLESKNISDTPNVLSNGYLWYHPNEWWKINSEHFPVSKDSFLYRSFESQYGYPFEYINGKWIDSTYRKWKVYNQFNSPNVINGHAWNIFILDNKEIFKSHPEYLSEINGERLGFGFTNKLCVTNENVKKLYIEYLINKIKKSGNESLMVSVEPSDGGKHCTCKDCMALGSVSNQVFYFANEIAKSINKIYPKAKFNLFSYYQHSLPPDFPIEKNIHLTVTPNGFQQLYSPEAIFYVWKDKVEEKTYYEYFGIPQWTGDMPRIEIDEIIKKVELSRKLGYKGFRFEVAVNINALILLNLWNKYLMYPDKGWSFIYNKFLEDCFPSSKEDMNRLFYRWHHIWLEKDEISPALYDLQQATKKTKDSLELERIRDIKAYVHYMILYTDWNNDVKNKEKAIVLLDYVHSVNHRKICNYVALSQIVSKHFKEDSVFVDDISWKKMIKKNKSELWITNDQIEQNFQNDINLFPPRKLNIDYTSAVATIEKMNIRKDQYLKEYNASFINSKFIDIYTEKPLQIYVSKIIDLPDNNNQEVTVTIQNENLDYLKIYRIKKGHNYIIEIPNKDQYRITFNQMQTAVASICGEFIPIIPLKSITNWTAFKYYYPDEQYKWKLASKEQKIIHRLPELFILAKP